jgi:hypothetical protein
MDYLLGGLLGVFDIVLQFACLCYPAVDIGSGLAGDLAYFILSHTLASFALPTISRSFGSALDGTDADATSSSCGNAPCSTDCSMASPSFSADTCVDIAAMVWESYRQTDGVELEMFRLAVAT